MPRIYVEFAKLKQCGDNFKNISSQVDKIRSDFRSTVKHLDWDIKYKADINKTADKIAQQLEAYAKALKKYQQFINEVQNQYSKLNDYKTDKLNITDFLSKVFNDVGSLGNITSIIDDFKNVIINAKDGDISKILTEYLHSGVDVYKLADKISEHIEEFKKIRADKSVKEACANWAKEIFDLEDIKKSIATADNPVPKFMDYITDVDSPFSLKQIINEYKWNGGISIDSTMTDSAKKAAEEAMHQAHKTSVLSWLDVAFSGISNYFDNKEEQATSDGKMSESRVVAETVIETGSGIILRKFGAAVIGAGITAAITAIGAPVAVPTLAVVVASNLAVTGLDVLFTKVSGKPVTEWISDGIMDGMETIASKIGEGVKSVMNPQPTWSEEIVVMN